ncbi:MAG: nitrilase family protein [Prevotella sp.]|nr:nitrilase family protein [Prevotella sp.]
MNIVLLQTDIEWGQPQTNIERTEQLMDTQPGADLYVLPEMWATGFATEPAGIAEREEQAVSLQWMKQTARERNCALSGSLAVKAADGTYRNRHYFVTPDEVTFYDKRHLFTHGHEDLHYVPGDRTVIACWRGFRFLLLTCYDLRFPVWSRWGRAGEYDAILLVANWPARRQLAWDTLVRARAIENQSYMVAVNRVGIDAAGIDYKGGSVVIDPVGRVLAGDNKNVEQAISCLLDMEKLQQMRNHFRVLDDRDQSIV